VRGYIRGISEGSQGEFGLSFGTQFQGIVPEGSTLLPEERLRIASNGNVIFRKQAIAPDGFIGNLIGIANTSTTIEVSSDTTNNNRFLTFVSSSSSGFRSIRTSSEITFNPSQKLLKVNNIEVGELRVGASDNNNFIAFRGTTGDNQPNFGGNYSHTFIGERIYSGIERSELLLFKGNDHGGPGNTTVGPDRVRVLAGEFRVDTYTSTLSGTFPDVGSATQNVFTRMTIQNNGNAIFSGTVTANSDIKLKENVITIESALEKVLSLRGVEYDRKDSGEHQIGVIAQEVEKIIS
jgi:hypothetical protein